MFTQGSGTSLVHLGEGPLDGVMLDETDGAGVLDGKEEGEEEEEQQVTTVLVVDDEEVRGARSSLSC